MGGNLLRSSGEGLYYYWYKFFVKALLKKFKTRGLQEDHLLVWYNRLWLFLLWHHWSIPLIGLAGWWIFFIKLCEFPVTNYYLGGMCIQPHSSHGNVEWFLDLWNSQPEDATRSAALPDWIEAIMIGHLQIQDATVILTRQSSILGDIATASDSAMKLQRSLGRSYPLKLLRS